MGVGTAIATTVGIAGKIYASSEARKATKKAAKASGKLYGPYIQAGAAAVGKLARGEFGEVTPAYAFRLKEAKRALNRRLARLGKTESGQAIAEDIGVTGRISAEEVDRNQSRLFGLASMGLTAAGGGAQAQQAQGGAKSSFFGDIGDLFEGIPGNFEYLREKGQTDPRSSFFQKKGKTPASSFNPDDYKLTLRDPSSN